MNVRRSALASVLDLVVYAPLGLALTVGEEIPKLVAKGRARVDPQVSTARVVGQFAVAEGRRRASKLTDQPAQARPPSAGAPPRRPSAAEAPPSTDTRPTDTRPTDTRVPTDLPGPIDTGLAETMLLDTVLSDTVLSDTVLSDTVLSDTVLSDTVLSDTVLSDTVLSDTVLSDHEAEPYPFSEPERPNAARSAGVSSPASPPSKVLGQPDGRRSAESLAIPGYDSLSASQVVQRLAGLSPAELAAVGAYEASSRGRRTILARVSQLQSS